MITAYSRIARHIPDNGLQVVMLTNQSDSVLEDAAHIFWESGLRITAVWYTTTQANRGTTLFVLRKRTKPLFTFRDDLAIELKAAIEKQIATLSMLNNDTKTLYHGADLFSDADLQIAGYGAALRVLTRYTEIDGIDMTKASASNLVKKDNQHIKGLLKFAGRIVNECLIPAGIEQKYWVQLTQEERFYFKMLDTESRNIHSLAQYKSFAKSFNISNFKAMMFSTLADTARLKSSVEMGGCLAMKGTPLMGILAALSGLYSDIDPDIILKDLKKSVADYNHRHDLLVAMAGYMATKLDRIRQQEAKYARIFIALITNEGA